MYFVGTTNVKRGDTSCILWGQISTIRKNDPAFFVTDIVHPFAKPVFRFPIASVGGTLKDEKELTH